MWAAARSAIASGYRTVGQIYAVPNVLIRKHTSLYICAGTAPGDAGLLAWDFPWVGGLEHMRTGLRLPFGVGAMCRGSCVKDQSTDCST